MLEERQNLNNNDKIRHNWRLSTLSLCLAYNFFFLNRLNNLNHNNYFNNELLLLIILGLVMNLLWVAIFYNCAYKKCGTGLLTWILVLSPFNLLNSALNFFKEPSGVLPAVIFSGFIGLHLWWYFSSFKLLKINKKFYKTGKEMVENQAV